MVGFSKIASIVAETANKVAAIPSIMLSALFDILFPPFAFSHIHILTLCQLKVNAFFAYLKFAKNRAL